MYISIALIAVLFFTFVARYILKKNAIGITHKPFFTGVKLLVLIAAVFLLFINLQQFRQYEERKRWQNTKAEIVSFEIVGIKTREPEIGYRFILNEHYYQGMTNLQTPLFGSRRYQEQTARTISGNYQVGDSVMVYYNPQKPAESALRIEPAWSVYIQFSFAVFLISAMLVILIPLQAERKN